MTNWLSLGIACLSALIAVSTATTNHRRQLFELARSLHQDLTTGAVQEARNRLGHVAHGSRDLNDDDLDEVLDAYFRLLWCFERINVGRNLMRKYSWLGRSPRVYLDQLVAWHVREWMGNFGNGSDDNKVRARLDMLLRMRNGLNPAKGLQDADSWSGFDELVKGLKITH